MLAAAAVELHVCRQLLSDNVAWLARFDRELKRLP